jgi:hypothetical protein
MKFLKTLLLISALGAVSDVRAQSVLNSLLGPTLPNGYVGSVPAQEFVSINSTVTPVGGGQYLYQYILSNPAGDEIMNSDGSLQAGSSEVVDYFAVSFNTAAPGALVGGPFGGAYASQNGSSGIFWLFNDVLPGSSSAPLSFYSDYPPTTGNAQALDSSAPSPWSSVNAGGQPVLVPNTLSPVPEPGTLVLLSLAGLTFFALRRAA